MKGMPGKACNSCLKLVVQDVILYNKLHAQTLKSNMNKHNSLLNSMLGRVGGRKINVQENNGKSPNGNVTWLVANSGRLEVVLALLS